MCVFITAVPIIKLFAWGEGDSGGHVLRETTSRDTVGSESLTCRWPPGPERPVARHAGATRLAVCVCHEFVISKVLKNPPGQNKVIKCTAYGVAQGRGKGMVSLI